MKKILLVMIGFTFFISVGIAITLKPNRVSSATSERIQQSSAETLPVSTATEPVVLPAATDVVAVETIPPVAPENGSDSQLVAFNAAAQFKKLPSEMQLEIKRLSGRDDPSKQPIEVKPGVFLLPAGAGPQVVPVAVMNEDGTVSIYEY